MRLVLSVLIFALSAASVQAADFEVSQKNKEFSVGVLEIKIGDSVSFTNADPFFHNVFSLSDAKTFDLGSYPAGQVRKVTFNDPGTVEVECAIHPNMKMTIQVKQ
mgnify:CR=1 FL=1